jgi:hypothetical protein
MNSNAPAAPPLEEALADHGDEELGEPIVGVYGDEDSPDEEVPDETAEEVGPEALSSRVWLGSNLPCSGPIYSYFRVPEQAYPYTARFSFVDAVGRRRWSGFAYWTRSEYPPTVIYASYRYAVPAGTRQIWAYWWCGVPSDNNPGSPRWNYKSVRCP